MEKSTPQSKRLCEFGISCCFAKWDIKNRLHQTTTPILIIAIKYDTMDPKGIEEQSRLVQKGRSLFCSNESHFTMWDDQKVFYKWGYSIYKRC